MTPLENITIRLSEWSDEIEKWQYLVPFDHPAGFKDYIFREHSNGRVKLAEIKNGDRKVGFLAYQIHCLEKREFYVLATFVEDKSIDYTDLIERFTVELAKRYNCVSLCFQTVRAGLIKKQIENGYRIAEVTLRKNIS